MTPKNSPSEIKPSNNAEHGEHSHASDNGTIPKDTIQSVREELEKKLKEWNKDIHQAGYSINTAQINAELEGFNLGVYLAQKEFLDWVIKIYNTDIMDEVSQIELKIEELKQSLEEKK